jgi:hypothetical protein
LLFLPQELLHGPTWHTTHAHVYHIFQQHSCIYNTRKSISYWHFVKYRCEVLSGDTDTVNELWHLAHSVQIKLQSKTKCCSKSWRQPRTLIACNIVQLICVFQCINIVLPRVQKE